MKVPTQTDIDTAERLSRRRARALPALVALFVAQQATFVTLPLPPGPFRTVDLVRAGAWIVLALVLLSALWSNGFWFRSRPVRDLIDDEVTRAHRADAMSLGFLAAMLTAIALYALTIVDPAPSRLALHLIVSAGIAAALARFGYLERRALRDG